MRKVKFVLRAAAAALLAALVIAPLAADDEVGPGQKLKNGKPQGKGWTNLIPKDLNGWKYQPDYWKVESGVLLGYTPGTPEHHYCYTEKEYADFELHADVKL